MNTKQEKARLKIEQASLLKKHLAGETTEAEEKRLDQVEEKLKKLNSHTDLKE